MIQLPYCFGGLLRTQFSGGDAFKGLGDLARLGLVSGFGGFIAPPALVIFE
jgi:hypothetical protein